MKTPAIILLLCLASAAIASDWPRDVQSSLGLITIYQPQFSSFTGNTLKARAAISIAATETSQPVFGAVWLNCRIETDRPNRTVALEDVAVRQIRFPAGVDQDTAKIADALETEIPRWDLTFSLDELLESIETAQKERDNAKGLDTEPPKIIFRDHPAVLVLIDGDPIIADVEGTSVKRVINTPFFLAEGSSAGTFFLRGGTIWYSASNPLGPWRHIESAPADVVSLAEQMSTDNNNPPGEANTKSTASPGGVIPEIVISTEPAELIATDGKMAFAPITGTGLLYVSNTPGRLFLEIATQHYFTLASGRWFTAATLDGPWSYVESNALPADFANIPPGSDCDDVLANVSGTLPAKEAIMDAQIPQTAEVDRAGATSDVEYDGDPQFDPIGGTTMSYAVNSSTPVILFEGNYYGCDRGVWFESPGPDGPWIVCTDVPAELYTIPPQCPDYYVRYVRVYGYTPTVVYTGYTSGYTGCYVYNGTVVYGTGYRYRPWHHHRYFARPWTWGFGIHYDPWTGWSMGHSRGWWRPHGWFAYDRTPGRMAWWGPADYRPLYRPASGPVYRAGYHPAYRPVVRRTATAQRPVETTRRYGETGTGTLYDRWATGVQRPAVRRITTPVRTTSEPVRRSDTEVRQTDQQKGRPTESEVRPAPQTKGRPEDQRAKEPARQVEKQQPPAPAPEVRPVEKAKEAPVRQQQVPVPPPPPQPSPKANDVFADPSGNILRKTPQTWEERSGNTWKPAPTPPPSSEVVRDAQVRQRSAERASSFTPPPPPPPPQPRQAPKPQPAPPSKPPKR